MSRIQDEGGEGQQPLDILNLNIYMRDQNPNTEGKGIPKNRNVSPLKRVSNKYHSITTTAIHVPV